jgi:lysyl-tRNA synthetase class 2
MLRRRAELLKIVRQFFDSRGFLEVETPLLSHDVVVDRHLDPLKVTLFRDPREPQRGETLWLQTSPEFAMKRLLVAGATAIYQITKVFRGGEAGNFHNPEFTMVEWYRVGDDYEAGMQILSDLAEVVLGRGPAERMTFREAFLRHAKVDSHEATEEQLREAAGWTTAPYLNVLNAEREGLRQIVLVCKVESDLGLGRPTILCDYPAAEAALARVRPGTPPVAERFELYVDGIELANGYHELLDPAILRERNGANNAARAADGKYTLPEESRLLAAMDQGLPACSGCALGFDRLVMVATGAKSIQEVMAFPIERA